jgi:methyl-accepting chemotaxis protein
MLSRLKIRTRMAAVFGALAAGLITIACLAVWQVNVLRTNLDSVPQLLDIRSALADWRGHTAVNAARTVAALQSEDPALGDRLAPAMKETSARISVIQKRIEEMALSPADRERFAAVGKARTAYLGARDETLKLRKAGDAGAAGAFDNKFSPALKGYETAIASFIDHYAQGQLAAHSAARDWSSQMLSIVAVAGLAFIVLAAILALLLERSITRPLSEATRVARTVASGDLRMSINVKSRDEVGQLLTALNEMTEALVRIVREVRRGTETIGTASAEISSGNADLSNRTEQQASSLEETASSMEELTGTVKQNADNARQANQLAAGASTMAVKGGEVVDRVVRRMSSINESSKKIADIISVIDGIAFQTNILALNAAVEAARAGEQGRGFAVVASEVRTLAQRSAAAAKEIKALITDSVAKVEDGSKLVDQAGHTMEEIVTAVKRVTDIMAEIAAASQEQTSGIEQINQAITQMDQTTQQNAALVEEAAAAAESMQEQAQSLTRAVSIFKLAQEEVSRSVDAASPSSQPFSRGEKGSLPSPRGKGIEGEGKQSTPLPRAHPKPLKVANSDVNWQEF